MKNKNKRKWLALVFLFLLGTVNAQQKTITVKEAVSLALNNSKQVRIGVAKKEEAAAALLEAQQARLPNFNLTSSYIRLNKPNIDLVSKSSTGTGGGSPNISQALYGIANLSYPVYAGGRLRYGVESAKYLEQAVRLDADKDREAVILNAVNAYVNLYKASAAIQVVKESLASSRQRDTTFSRLEQNGILARNDLLKSQLQTSGLELSLLDAESNRDLANINMNLMLGLPESTVLVTENIPMVNDSAMKSIADYEQLAMQFRKDIQALDFRKKAASLSTRIARAEGYPSIALTGGYIAADIPGFMTITNAVNVGVGIQYNLSSLWKSNTRLQQAKARENAVKANQELLDDAIRLEINQDYQAWLLGTKRTEVFQKALLQAQENFRITKNKYDNSLANVTELLDADVALTQSRLNVSVARADAWLAYNKLLYTAGVITIE